ncbi:sucrose nonfermenting 4-like protein isoform X2 [Phalaenopsis equestris]|uniref:sucrose nonfermenting 4-like protein isoform X2 n=1 Tax=Phalaenopsis equestris TaxID=78828 RepID=UPI0009E4D7D0|nr:sucrose nonfermenting 4-like protein isoform X2 [Phalaenopsis equestris]
MFSSGVDASQDLSGTAGAVLIPTRWSDHLPMSPMEDRPTAFQAICNLTPGLHQYKFFVDGEWRHDENQPHMSGNYGIVNNLLLTNENNLVPSILSPGASGSREMDVDNETFRRTVNISGSSVQEAALRISEANIELFRNQISIFLLSNTAYDLLPDSGKVIALDVNLPVKQAFHILYEQEIPVAPLWDLHRGQFVGMLSALDFILILKELGNHGSNLTEEELETHTISAWKLVKRQRYGQLDVHGRPIERALVHAGPYDTLKDVTIKIIENEVATVPIIHSMSPDGSFPQLLHLASLSGILRCICRHFRHSSSSLPILQQPICNIPMGTWVTKIGEANRSPLAMLRPNASLGSALSLLVEARVSCIPIVDDDDVLLDTYSRSDITALAKDRAYAQIHLDKMTVHQAMQLAEDTNSAYGYSTEQRSQTCFRTETLQRVMERLSSPGVRRLIIVEATGYRVEGIISLSDLFKFLLG